MENAHTVSDAVRARGIGELLDLTFRQYRSHFQFLILAAVYLLVPYLILDVAFNHSSFNQLQTLLSTLTHSHSLAAFNQMQQQNARQPFNVMSQVLLLLDMCVVMPLLFGTILHFVSEITLYERKVTLADAVAHAFRRLLPNFVTLLFVILFFVAGSIVLGILFSLVVGAIALLGHSATVAALIAGILTGVIMLIAASWIAVKFAFVSAVVFEEKSILWRPIARSFGLTRHSFWRCLGFFLLVGFLVLIVTAGVNTAGLLLIHNATLAMSITSIVSILTTTFFMLATSNLYVDLRVRADALDFQQLIPEDVK